MRTETTSSTLRALTIALALALCGCLWFAAQASARIYWTNGNSIARANVEGSEPEPAFVTGSSESYGVVATGNFLYWTNGNSIGRSSLDGKTVDPNFLTGLNSPISLAIDDGHIYWTSTSHEGSIGRADLDGKVVENEFLEGVGAYFGIGLSGEYLYWVNEYETVGRAKVSGEEAEEVDAEWLTLPGSPTSYGMTASGNYIYWTNATGANTSIGRANVSGEEATEVEENFVGGLVGVAYGVAVNGNFVYWAGAGTESIGRAKLDGTDVEPEIASAGAFVGGLATDVSQPTLTNVASPGIHLGEGAISDTATLAEGGGPTGPLTFRLYGPGDESCSGAPAYTDVVQAKGNGAYSPAPFEPTSLGTYRWTVSYPGNFGNLPVATNCGEGTAAVEVAVFKPTLTNVASAGILIGAGTLSDTATLAGAGPTDATLTFRLFGPADESCSGAPVYTDVVTAKGDGNYSAAPFTPTAVGTYRWTVGYAGNKGNLPAATSCSAASAAARVIPPNAFETRKVGRNKKKGNGKLGVNVAWAGTVEISGKGVKTKTKQVSGPGTFKVALVPRGSYKKLLAAHRRGFTTVMVSFTPTGGEAAPAKTIKLRLVKR